MSHIRHSLRMKLLIITVLPALLVAVIGGSVASIFISTEDTRTTKENLLQQVSKMDERLNDAFDIIQNTSQQESHTRNVIYRARSAYELGETEDGLKMDLFLSIISALESFVSTKGMNLCAVYSPGGLKAYTTAHGTRLVTTNKNGILTHFAPASPSARLRFSRDLWQPAAPLAPIPEMISIPLGIDTKWVTTDNGLVLESIAPIMAKVFDEEGLTRRDEIVGALLFSEAIDNEWLARITKHDTHDVALFSPAGVLLATNRPELFAAAPSSKIFVSEEAGFSTIPLAGNDFFMMTAPFKRNEKTAFIIATFSSAEALARKTRTILLLELAGLGCGFLLALSISILAGRIFIRPIEHIAEQMSEIAATQDFTRKINITSKDEIGLLAHSFNNMTVRLREAYAALMRSREELEKRVSERTKDLKETNERLQNEIAERQNTAGALRIAKEMAEEATRAKSEFLANISHEIRTPLNAIIGMGHIMRKTPLTSTQKDYLGKMDTASRTLLQIVENILDFSRLESGAAEADSIAFALDETLQRLANSMTRASEKKELDLLFDIAPATPLDIIGDPLKLYQVLHALTDNAIKFTQQGEVIISARPIKKDGASVTLEFSVKDTGIGMDPDKVNELFVPFTQADSTFTRQHGGTGIGLALSKRIVEILGGTISISTRPGKGTTVTFAIPVLQNENLERQTVSVAPNLEGRKALIVDDSPSARQIFANMLLDMGFVVSQADNGAEGYERVKQADESGTPFDLVLIDWRMPGMNGVETTRTLQNDESLSSPPRIIMATAFPHESIIKTMQDVTFDGILTKPISRAALQQAVEGAFTKGVRHITKEKQEAPRPRDVHSSAPALPRSIAGVDMEVGLRRTAGNQMLYASLLRRLANDALSAQKRLPHLISSGRISEARMLTHTLIGLAENAAATALSNAASELAKALTTGGETAPILSSMENAISAIHSALPEDKSEGSESTSSDQDSEFSDAIRVLNSLLSSIKKKDSATCTDLMERLAGLSWTSTNLALLSALSALIARERYPEAQNTTEELINRLEGDGRD